MSMYKEEAGEEIKEFNVYSLGKGRRILLYLADFFLVFIFSLAFFNLAVYPLGGLALGMEEKYNSYVSSSSSRDEVLYGNLLLYHGSTTSPKNLTDDLEYTCDCFASYYAYDGEEQYEVFKTYFVDIRNDQEGYLSFYKEVDSTGEYFLYEGYEVSLKQTYIDQWSPKFRPNDTISEAGEESYATFQSKFFLKGYSLLLDDILENDLTYNGVSYVATQNEVDEYLSHTTMLTVACSYISYLLSICIVFVLTPLVSRNRKSIGMLLLRRERVDATRLILLKKRHIPLIALYALAFNAWSVFFVPMTTVSFNELFSLPVIFPISCVSLAISVISLCFILIDPFNRSLSDRLTFSVIIDEENLETCYRAKGYKI